MLLAKRSGGSTIRGHTWKHDDAAVDVPYDLAMELLAIKGGGFYVPEPEPEESEPPKAKAKDKGSGEEKAAAPPAPAPPAAKPAADK
jgi:hypothetical protein